MPTSHSAPVADFVFDRLLDDIVSGRCPAGGHLPAERQLADELHASRATVAKATAKLVDWRLLSIRQGSGMTVRPRVDWSYRALPAFLPHASPTEARAITRDLFGLLRSLCSDAALRISPRFERGSFDAVRAAVARAWDCRHDPTDWFEADGEQFRLTLEIAGAWATMWLINDLDDVYRRLMGELAPATVVVPRDYVARHLDYLDALERNELASAAALLDAYLDRHETAVRKAIRRSERRRTPIQP